MVSTLNPLTIRLWIARSLYFDREIIKYLEKYPNGTIANKKVIEQGGMDKKANLVWGINDIRKITKWGNRIEIVNNMPMFKEFKKKYPIKKRIGMIISDIIKVMALCHFKITGKNGV